MKPRLCLVTPALRAANNGNWQTAWRWSRMLASHYRVRVVDTWDGGDDDILLALHARRSATAVAAFAAAHPGRPLLLALTGTDLYRDIASDASAQRSLALAWRLIVLNEQGPAEVPAAHRAKVALCLQSTPPRRTLAKTARHLRALMVGHLRDEKSPQTLFDAARRLVHRSDILIDHVGAALDPALAEAARATAAACPRYRWLGPLPHAQAVARTQRAHLLVNTSRMEGGAQVVSEALQCGTPVLASAVPGHRGLLGADYGGFFPHGDGAALATLLERARDEPAMLIALQRQCAARAPLFDPERERATLLQIVRHAQEMPR